MDEIFSVAGQVVCISGASRGLGKSIALAFAQRGAHVIAGSWNEAELASAKAEFAALGLKLGTEVIDVVDPLACARFVRRAVAEHGHIDTMICNAGIDIVKAAESYEESEWNNIIDVNLKGAYFCAKEAALPMLSAGCGSIIFTSSIAGSSGIPNLAPYTASKGGIDQLVRTMAVEWATRGIRVNGVAPGYINNFMAGVDADADASTPYQRRAMSRTPMGRRGELGEFAGAYVYLASNASSYVTGHVLYVDGGYHAA